MERETTQIEESALLNKLEFKLRDFEFPAIHRGLYVCPPFRLLLQIGSAQTTIVLPFQA